jgi:hypothetical protein
MPYTTFHATKRNVGAELGLTGRKLRELHFKLFGPGNTIFVQSGYQTGGNGATSIEHALAQCTPYRGDVIVVNPGHVETITGTLDINVAGVTIIGRGFGSAKSLRPKIKSTTATAAKVLISARDVTIEGIDFECAIDSQAVMIDPQNDGCTFEGCRFYGREDAMPVKVVSHADLHLTDIESTQASGWKTVISATGGFTSNMVGRYLYVYAAGTNFTTGRYLITGYTDTNTITVNSACGSTGDASGGSGAVGTADNVRFSNCDFDFTTDATSNGTHCIDLAGTFSDWTFEYNHFAGDWSTGIIVNATVEGFGLRLIGNDMLNTDTNSGNKCVLLGAAVVSETSGVAYDNRAVHLYNTAINCYDMPGLVKGHNYEGNELAKYGAIHGTEDT